MLVEEIVFVWEKVEAELFVFQECMVQEIGIVKEKVVFV